MELEAIICEVRENEGFFTFTPFSDTYLLEKRGITAGRLILDDSRTISAIQRKHIYGVIRDISEHTGDIPEWQKEVMKDIYLEVYGGESFSLSNCDMTTARHFLQFLIEFCIEQDISMSKNPVERAPDIARYIYACTLHRKCCVSGLKADIHHTKAIGAGMNRKKVIHLGMEVMPLAREYHNEAHTIGQPAFNEKYKVFPITLDEMLCKALGLNTEAT